MPDSPSLDNVAATLVRRVLAAAAVAPNEASLRHEIEGALEESARALGIPWTPFRLDLALPREGASYRFADVAHGAVLIEYEPPGAFSGRREGALAHAREQAAEYGLLLAREEGRPLEHYVLVVWDGARISFGRYSEGSPLWEGLVAFDRAAALRLLSHLQADGTPLVHPLLLRALVGPETQAGTELIPRFFRAIRARADGETTRTKLLFFEWRRLFGQVVGTQSEHLRNLLRQQEEAHGETYSDDPAAYLFALNTYIALVAKLAAAFALPGVSEDLGNPNVPVGGRIQVLESGQLFVAAGVANMLSGDFFSWYAEDPSWPEFADPVHRMISALSATDFRVTRKSAESTRDLFKGLYHSFVPRALRHALGEYYTPDWLAEHVLDEVGWTPDQPLIDPTCGSGTFLLEGMRRRLMDAADEATAEELLAGFAGFDLNPIAVLAARASLVVFLSNRLDPRRPIRLPIYLADAVNPVLREGGQFRHTLQTELGEFEFTIPEQMVEKTHFFDLFARIRELLDAEVSVDQIVNALGREDYLRGLDLNDRGSLTATIAALGRLEAFGWDGIWCSILAERFAAAATKPSAYVCGNPPWVKWSHLPPDYANLIKRRCFGMGAFSDDRWVGGIESDISTVITLEAAHRWLAQGGKLAFLLPGSIFSNESSQGFRRFRLEGSDTRCEVLGVEDYHEIAPFEGVSNHATLLILRKGAEATYPVPYRVWKGVGRGSSRKRSFASAEAFRREACYEQLLASPVPGTDAGPWLKGTAEQHQLWSRMFRKDEPAFRARKGITTDANGIYFVRAEAAPDPELCDIWNDPGLGRRSEIPAVGPVPVEARHLYPLLRGKGIGPFSAIPDPEHRVLLPQSGMHGDPDLPVHSKHTYRYLSRFSGILSSRSSLRRFQRGKPYWSIWSVGDYTFSEYKVVWKEMSGQRFAAAIVEPYSDPLLGTRVVIPDHKVYFVPCAGLQEAGYLAAVLNSPAVATAISSYGAQLSLGVSVVEYLAIPAFSPDNSLHQDLSNLALALTKSDTITSDDYRRLNELALQLFSPT